MVLTGYKKFMNDEEITFLLKFISKQTTQIKLIFLILIFMGLRVGEVCSLKRNNIQGNRLIFRLEKSERIHERIIPNFLVQLLNGYIESFTIYEGWLFPTAKCRHYNGRNEHIMPSSVGCYIKTFRDEYGKKYPNLKDVFYTTRNGMRLYRISCHTIRHWFLTKVYQKSNGDVLLVADVIGHKKLETTFDYLRAWKKLEREKQLVNKIVVELNDGFDKTSSGFIE